MREMIVKGSSGIVVEWFKFETVKTNLTITVDYTKELRF